MMEQSLVKKWVKAGNLTISRLVLAHYRDIGLNEVDLVTLLELKSDLDQGQVFPDPQDLAKRMHISQDQAFDRIHSLIQKKVLEIQTAKGPDGKSQDVYSLDPLYNRLLTYLDQNQHKEEAQNQEEAANRLYKMFESEFGRPLSPIEIETISAWIDEDKYQPGLIQMALKQAVLNQVYNLRYIDRVLLSWQRKNIRTKDQVLAEEEKYRKAREGKSQPDSDKSSNQPQVPLYNWLQDLKDKDQSQD